MTDEDSLLMFAADVIAEPTLAAFVIGNAADLGVPIAMHCNDEDERDRAMAALEYALAVMVPCQGSA